MSLVDFYFLFAQAIFEFRNKINQNKFLIMKKIFTFLLSVACAATMQAQSVSVNTDGTTADASSILDVKSTTKGMLVPRMTTAQRTAIATPATGLLVFDTDTKTFWFYSGLIWTNINTASGGGSFTLPYNGSTSATTSALGVVNTGTGAAIEGSGSTGTGVYGNSFSGAGVNALSTNGFGLIANSTNGSAVYGFSTNGLPTIKSVNNGAGTAIEGQSKSGSAIYGNSVDGAGVNALSTNGFGLIANSTNSSAIYGFTANAASTIKGVNTVGDGVRGQSSGNGVAGVSGISTAPSGYGVWGNSNTGTGILAQSSSGVALEVNGKLKIAGGNTNPANGAVLTSDANGNAVWKNNRIAFGIRDINSNFTLIPNLTWRKIQFAPTDFYDFGNNFNLLIGTNVTPTSSAFVAPVTGVYHFDAMVTYYSIDDPIVYCSIRLVVNSGGTISTFSGVHFLNDPAEYLHTPRAAISKDIYLKAGDIVHVEGYGEDEDATGVGLTNGYLNGHLVIAQ